MYFTPFEVIQLLITSVCNQPYQLEHANFSPKFLIENKKSLGWRVILACYDNANGKNVICGLFVMPHSTTCGFSQLHVNVPKRSRARLPDATIVPNC